MVFTPWRTAHGDADYIVMTVAEIVAISPADDSVDTNTIILTGTGTIHSFGDCPHIVTKLVHFMPETAPVEPSHVIDLPPPPIDPLAPTSTVTTTANPASGGTTTGDGSYPRGSTVTVIAAPNANFVFVNWIYKNGLEASVDATYSFTLTSNTDLVAQFKPATITVVNSPLLSLLTGADRVITTEAYASYRCRGDSKWYEISFAAVGDNQGALLSELEARVAALEAKT